MIRKLKIAPIILVLLGAVFLLNNFGVLPWGIWNNLWKFWPIILILIGVEYLIGQAISLKTTIVLLLLIFLIPLILAVNPITNNPLASEEIALSEPLAAITKAKIIVDMPATNLEIGVTNDPVKLIEGKVSFSKAANKPRVSVEESFGQKILKITQTSVPGLPFLSSLKNSTSLFLTPQIPLEIQINTEASKEKMDLTDLRIDYLEINSKASDLNIIFGGNYSSRANLNIAASNLRITIPKAIEARVRIDSKVKNLSISSRFKKAGGEYKTSAFDKAFTRIDIRIESIAGSIAIK